MTEHSAWTTLFECLQAKPRRKLVTGLAARQPTETVHFTELRDDETADGTPIHAEYVHVHLPKLAAAGYISWNEQSHDISRGPRFDEVETFVELVQSHSERLPDGWV